MSPPFYSEMLFPYQRSYDVKHNLRSITAVRAPDRQIWTCQAQAATGFSLCMPKASAQHNTSRRHHVLWPCTVRLAFCAANEWRPSSCRFVRSSSKNISCSRKPLLQLKRACLVCSSARRRCQRYQLIRTALLRIHACSSSRSRQNILQPRPTGQDYSKELADSKDWW